MTWVLRAQTHATAVGWLDDIVRRTVSTACADMANRPTARPADTPHPFITSHHLLPSRGRQLFAPPVTPHPTATLNRLTWPPPRAHMPSALLHVPCVEPLAYSRQVDRSRAY